MFETSSQLFVNNIFKAQREAKLERNRSEMVR
jgi:hypothetical protein